MNCLRPTSKSSLPAMDLEHARLKRMASDLCLVVDHSLPAGCLEWADQCRPDLVRYLSEAKEAVRGAADSGNRQEFLAAAELCTKRFCKTNMIFHAEFLAKMSVEVSAQLAGVFDEQRDDQPWAG